MIDRVFYVEEVLNVKDRWRAPDGEFHYLCRDEQSDSSWTLEERGIEDWQLEILRALDAGETRISIRSGNGVGKTALVAWLGSHFLLFRDDVKVIVTSPSFSQLNDGLIPETRKWFNRLPLWLKEQVNFTTDRATRYPENKNNFISFRTARKETPEALQGIHATHVMLLIDEASGVHDVVFEAGQGTMSTAGAIVIMISNPTRVTGLFFRTQRKLRGWFRKVVSCFESTRVDPEFPKMIADTYGLTSQQYRVKVLGEFPEGNADSVVPREWVESAVGRDVSPIRGMRVWGVDPGRGNDPTGFCEREANIVTELEEKNFSNTMHVVGWVKKKWDALEDNEKPEMIYVDAIGIGAGVADRLEEMGLPITAINVAEVAAMEDRFVRLRAELWYNAREWFEGKGVVVSSDIDEKVVDKFIEEMSETCFKDHSSGRTDVESKRDLAARQVKSPNLADAFCLTLSEGGAMMNGIIRDTNWDKPLNYKSVGVV
jgi:phage terminase large subunit